MVNVVQADVDRMMRWCRWALVPLLLGLQSSLLLRLVDTWAQDSGYPESPRLFVLCALLGALSIASLLAGIICLPVALWTIFRTGQKGFGILCALVYLFLAVVLVPLLAVGLFAIPHMIRLDLMRVQGIELESLSEGPAEPLNSL